MEISDYKTKYKYSSKISVMFCFPLVAIIVTDSIYILVALLFNNLQE